MKISKCQAVKRTRFRMELVNQSIAQIQYDGWCIREWEREMMTMMTTTTRERKLNGEQICANPHQGCSICCQLNIDNKLKTEIPIGNHFDNFFSLILPRTSFFFSLATTSIPLSVYQHQYRWCMCVIFDQF